MPGIIHQSCCCRACLSCGDNIHGHLEDMIPSTVTMDADVRYREWSWNGAGWDLIRDCTQHITQTLYLDTDVCQYDALVHNPGNLPTLYCHDGSGTDGDGAAFGAWVKFQRTTTFAPASPNPEDVQCGWIAFCFNFDPAIYHYTHIDDDPDGSPLGAYPGTIYSSDPANIPPVVFADPNVFTEIYNIVLS